MKTPSNPAWSRHALPLALLLSTLLPWSLRAIDPDLPFSSGSLGEDGALTFREIDGTGRNSFGMAYDAVRQQTVIFGGWVGASLNDTWVFDGTNWKRVFPATSPLDRYGHKMVWDAARGEIVMFGGLRNGVRLNDTWTWNGTTWTQKTPASSPSPRDWPCMAYDVARSRVVLFSGNGGADETWLWDGTNWTQANPASKPPASVNSTMAYDEARQRVVMFGNYGQTWLWDGANWTQANPAVQPAAKGWPAMAYDPVRQEIVMFSGSNAQETWTWNGTIWTLKSPATSVVGRQYHQAVWDGKVSRILVHGGDVAGGVDNYSADTYLWNGTDWTYWSGKIQTFDMSARPSGIYRYTSIVVPPGVTVRFNKNVGNTPVRWLASGDVTINGTVDLSGEYGWSGLAPGVVAQGGPGGFAGGRGGIRSDASGSFVGQPGAGPGGGDPGTSQQTNPNLRDGKQGEFNGTYGNAFLQPLTGGSGGGGGASAATGNGGNGGGGGGAIMISSSRDITLNGIIRANGQNADYINSYGGRGSGGGILLRADRITGPGSLEAYGGTTGNPNGRIRLESFVRNLTGAQTPIAVIGLPSANGELNQVGTLSIVSVKGVNVAQPPTGNPNTPDVVFTDAGAVTIVVSGVGIPNNTPVNLRIVTATQVIQSPAPVNMVNNSATFNMTVPAGTGTIQATAQYTSN